MLLSPASTSGSLPSPGPSFWDKFKPRGGKDQERNAHMSLQRQRLLTLAYGEMETIRKFPSSFAELEAVARDWAKPPPDAHFSLRVPVEYASFRAARLVEGPYIYLTGEDSYQIACLETQGLRVEIASDGPPPPVEPPPPPPPPVLEMPCTLNLELQPGQHVALETMVSSEELDMARMEDGTLVEGKFWGKLDIAHSGDTHNMEFSGTRIVNQEFSPNMLIDARVVSKLAVAAKPPTAKCQLSILAPNLQYCDVILSPSGLWRLGVTWPPAENVAESKVKYFLRVHPGGALEHYDSEIVTTALYYEAIPDHTMVDPHEFVAPRNGFAMSFRDFIPHLMNVLDQLGLSLHARSNFINNNMAAFSVHKNIAYRFLSPSKIAAAIDISVTVDSCVFTRLFLIFRGISDDEMGIFSSAGEKEANSHNWREVVGWTENSKDAEQFRVLEISVMEVT